MFPMISAIPVVLLLALFFTAPAHAQVYKCKNQNNQIVYTDAPCASGSSQILTDIQVTGAVNSNLPKEQSALTRQMDTAVKAAIATGDLNRAQALATTKEHWEWIAIARREQNNAQNTVIGRTEADLSAERGDTLECQQAKRSLELEANSSLYEPSAIHAKRSLMRAACGIKEPNEIIYDNRTTTFFRHPIRPLHPIVNPHGYTSPPYDRHMEKPFGSRWIRPEDGIR
ncbi:MAG TPA: DUF4124 domain-containing protein [Methylophilaceae bacterium]|nr:DUF4124 domain-containing protein [Methylophilaceae bacterium]